MKRLVHVVALCAASALLLAVGVSAAARASSIRDLPRIVDPKPVRPLWSFQAGDPYIHPTPAHTPAFTQRELIGESPTNAAKAFATKLTRAGFVTGRHLRWEASNLEGPNRLPADAVVFAFLFRDATGARAGFRVLRSSGAPEPGSRPLPATGLGEQAWAVYEPGGTNGNEAGRYLWRRSNLVTLAEIVCDTECGFDVVPPARAYADQIDARAKRRRSSSPWPPPPVVTVTGAMRLTAAGRLIWWAVGGANGGTRGMYRTFEVRSGRQVVALTEAITAREAVIEYLLGRGCRRDELVSMGDSAVAWRGAVYRAAPAPELEGPPPSLTR